MALQRIADAAGVSLILILSDINMPGMNGLGLLLEAKALRPDVPVIMITAYGDAETKRKAFENGAEALLTKPIDFVVPNNQPAGHAVSFMAMPGQIAFPPGYKPYYDHAHHVITLRYAPRGVAPHYAHRVVTNNSNQG